MLWWRKKRKVGRPTLSEAAQKRNEARRDRMADLKAEVEEAKLVAEAKRLRAAADAPAEPPRTIEALASYLEFMDTLGFKMVSKRGGGGADDGWRSVLPELVKAGAQFFQPPPQTAPPAPVQPSLPAAPEQAAQPLAKDSPVERRLIYITLSRKQPAAAAKMLLEQAEQSDGIRELVVALLQCESEGDARRVLERARELVPVLGDAIQWALDPAQGAWLSATLQELRSRGAALLQEAGASNVTPMPVGSERNRRVAGMGV